MIGTKLILGKKSGDEAEKPFWISYADLMTALMMLFLVIMVVSLLSLISAQEGADKEREQTITRVFETITKRASEENIKIETDLNRRVISFDKNARFANSSAEVNPQAAQQMRALTPIILDALTENDKVRHWFKRVTIEGYTSASGDYFYNLKLSLSRSHNVLCKLLNSNIGGFAPLTQKEKLDIRRMFMVGGFSANSTTGDAEKDRRVELRIEFWTPDELTEQGRLGNDSHAAQQRFDNMPVGDCTPL